MKQKGRVSTKGQLIVPAAMRRKHGIESGTQVLFEDVEGGILVRPLGESAIKHAYGFLRDKGWPQNLEKEPDREIE
jgi:AbrB family looped-hinge helix DNA binding protein